MRVPPPARPQPFIVFCFVAGWNPAGNRGINSVVSVVSSVGSRDQQLDPSGPCQHAGSLTLTKRSSLGLLKKITMIILFQAANMYVISSVL